MRLGDKTRSAARRTRSAPAPPSANRGSRASTAPARRARNTDGIQRRDPKACRRKRREFPQRRLLHKSAAGDSTTTIRLDWKLTGQGSIEVPRRIFPEGSSRALLFKTTAMRACYVRTARQHSLHLSRLIWARQFNPDLILLKPARNGDRLRYSQ